MSFQILVLLGLIAFSTPVLAQKKTRSSKANLSALPAGVTYSGKAVHSLTWKDREGRHVFIASESGLAQTADSAGSDLKRGTITARHYVLADTNRLTWTETDSVVGCGADADLGFLTSAFQLTDLDSDGIYELWLVKRSACRSDVSPADMQLVMHEGDQRFTMIGKTRVRISEKESIGGEYDFNNQFLEGNPKFKKRGMDMWNDFMKE
jgi:hypothetical protein